MFKKDLKKILLLILTVFLPTGCGYEYYYNQSNLINPTYLKWSTVFSTLSTSTCSSGLTVSTLDTNFNLLQVLIDTTVSLSNIAGNLTTPGSGLFYADSNCSVPITSIVIAAGNNTSPVFYFKDAVLEAQPFNLTASAPGYKPVPPSPLPTAVVTPVTMSQSFLYVVLGQIGTTSIAADQNTIMSYTTFSDGTFSAMSSNPLPLTVSGATGKAPGPGGTIVNFNTQNNKKSFWYMRGNAANSLAGIFGFSLNNYPASSGGTPTFTGVSSNPTAPTGDLTNAIGKIAADSVGTFSGGPYLYVAGSGTTDNNIYAYPINSSTGALGTPTISSIGAGLSPKAVALSSAGNLCFVLDLNGATWEIRSFTVGANGTLTATGFVSAALGIVPGINIFLQVSDKFLYTITSNRIDLVPYNNATGSFSAPVNSNIMPNVNLKDLTADPTGKWLYVAKQTTGLSIDAVDQYTINSSTGVLTFASTAALLNGGAVTVGLLQSAQWLTVGSNAYLYVIYNGSLTQPAAIGSYFVNPSTGAISLNATSSVPSLMSSTSPMLMSESGNLPIFGAPGLSGPNGIMVSAVPY